MAGVDDKGTFSGDSLMDRAQACTILCKLNAYIEKHATDNPEPEKPVTGADSLKNGKPATEANVLEMLADIREEYPTGTLWADRDTEGTAYNPNRVSSAVSKIIGKKHWSSSKYGCGGFAAMVSDLIFTENAECREVTDFSKVRPGDIIVRVDSSTGDPMHIMIAVGNSYIEEGTTNGVPFEVWAVDIADGNHNRRVIWNEDNHNYTGLYSPDSPSSSGFIYYVYTRYPA